MPENRDFVFHNNFKFVLIRFFKDDMKKDRCAFGKLRGFSSHYLF